MPDTPLELLVHLRRTDVLPHAAVVGLALARRVGAWVRGVHVVPLAPLAFSSPEAVAYVDDSAERIREAAGRDAFWRAALREHGVDGEWCVSQGDPVETLCHLSRACDLLVMERPQSAPDAPVGWGLVSRTVFGASAPVLVVPERLSVERVGATIAIAWNGSREVALAVRGALPLLRRANAVHVFEGASEDDPLDLRFVPRIDLRDWLARQRIDARIVPFEVRRERGAALLQAAQEVDADLLVMGAWGHSRLTELVVGGTTRHLFQHSDRALLVAH